MVLTEIGMLLATWELTDAHTMLLYRSVDMYRGPGSCDRKPTLVSLLHETSGKGGAALRPVRGSKSYLGRCAEQPLLVLIS